MKRNADGTRHPASETATAVAFWLTLPALAKDFRRIQHMTAMRTLIKHALASTEPRDSLVIRCWVRTRRDSKGFSFLEINDGSCLASIQVVADTGTAGYADIAHFTTGVSAIVEGSLVASPAAGQKWEVKAKRIELVGPADPAYPLQKKGHTAEFLRTIAHLRPRSNLFGAVFRTRSRLALAVHQFFQEHGVHAASTTESKGG
jgi:asparaginyl-tRNA synthetase